MARLSAGILTVSDTLAAQPAAQRADGAGDAAEAHLAALGMRTRRALVPDDAARIAAQVRAWRDGSADETPCDLIVTSGGTGFGVRDGTPEALAPLIDKPAPGLTHLLVAASLQYTPLAALSRPVCGVSLRRPGADGIGALVVALPGSRKAVRECLEALGAAGVLAHALDLVTGGSGRAVHARLQGPEGGRDGAAAAAQGVGGTETDTGHARVGGTDRGTHHAHHHGDHVHHHGDHAHHHSSHSHSHSAPQPRTAYVTVEPGAPAGRHRQSPYTLQPLDAALALIAQHTPGAGAARREPLARLAGCVLAADVCASLDLPPRATSNVDGYAVLAASTPAGEYRVVRGGGASGPPQGAVCRINTGQALPLGTDAVVMVEDTQLLRATAAGEEEAVRVLAQVDARENVRAAGSDVRAGDVVLRAGQRVGTLGGEIGTLAFLGCAEALVYPKPVVAILSTGNELQDIGAAQAHAASAAGGDDGWDFRVWDSNRPGLRAAIEGQGFEVLDLGIVGDDRAATVAALQRGIAHADVVLTTGGTSMGESDLLKPIIERDLGGTIHFGRVAMKPGKPTTFATLPAEPRPKVLFALPGNPASALVCFSVFVLPALRKLGGHSGGEAAARIKVRLAEALRLDPRPEFHRVVVAPDANGELVARSTGVQRSSGMHSMATANALVCVPALEVQGPRTLEAGALADAILLGPL